ncbi:hypothetical protein EVAR_36020_1 [Eumeta japonica]|uniref:Uncharacterized protein n=1 Tax=Eumeta variegata TaxID=151549 RepID=A0A4C1WQU9_EUMVA|nr:hypothetical protein EVAR_36020_1 [Eumeta japonica]
MLHSENKKVMYRMRLKKSETTIYLANYKISRDECYMNSRVSLRPSNLNRITPAPPPGGRRAPRPIKLVEQSRLSLVLCKQASCKAWIYEASSRGKSRAAPVGNASSLLPHIFIFGVAWATPEAAGGRADRECMSDNDL